MTLPSLDLLAAVVADRSAHLGALDRLGIDTGGTGGGLPAGLRADLRTERVHEVLPGAVLLPGHEVIPDGALGHQIVRQIVPLTAGAGLIHQGVDDLAQVHLARSAAGLGGRKQILDQSPLCVGQVGSVRLTHGGGLLAWLFGRISFLVLGFTGALAFRRAFYSANSSAASRWPNTRTPITR